MIPRDRIHLAVMSLVIPIVVMLGVALTDVWTLFPPALAWIIVFVLIPFAGAVLFMRYGLGLKMFNNPDSTELHAVVDDQIGDKIEERYEELHEEVNE